MFPYIILSMQKEPFEKDSIQIPRKVLKELVTDIKRGLSSYYLQDEGKMAPLINIRDVSKGTVNTETVAQVKIKETPALKKTRIVPGDIIITVKGSAFKAAVAGLEVRDYIISSNLIAFTINDEILPELVAAYLNSPEGQAQLQARASGIAQKFLNEKALMEMPIPIPPKDKQTQLAIYLSLSRELNFLIEREYELRAQLNDRIIRNIMR